MDLTETLIRSEPIDHKGFLKIDRDTVRLANGNEHVRLTIHHPGAACVLAITADERVVLVRQWRHPAGRALLEIPAGKLDEGEDPAACALRELSEETPYTAEHVEKITAFYSAPGFCDEVLHVFRAVNITPNSTLSPDVDELLETVLYTRQEIQQGMASGEICDAKTLIALQFWLLEEKH